jgi:hypothetical protein
MRAIQTQMMQKTPGPQMTQMTQTLPVHSVPMRVTETKLPWYREATPTQWKVFLTTFAAWTLDAFDFTIITFVLIDIQNSFSVNKALAGLLGTR